MNAARDGSDDDSPSVRAPVITVDGPGGTGKGALCGLIADWLGWHLLDSGALYRLLAAVALKSQIDPGSDNGADNSEAELAEMASALDPEFRAVPGVEGLAVWLAGVDWTGDIRTEACGAVASKIAAFPAVRAALLARQRAFQRLPGLIADGRDMGTVVFPDAELKIFLTADSDERALRRHKQLIGKGIDVNLAQLSKDIADRDRRDSERPVSPLKPADDAVVIDTTSLSIEGVSLRARTLVEARGLQNISI